MLLPWLMCHLAAVAAIPVSPSPTIFALVERIANTMNDTEEQLECDYSENQEQKICETEYCYEIARKIQDGRDLSADPCENFYQYACGSWEKHNPIPDNEFEWSQDRITLDKMNKRIREILEEPDSNTDIPPVRMVRKLYRSCMDVDAIEKKGIKPIQEILDRNGGWPMAMPKHAWNPNKVPWQTIDKHYVPLIGTSAFYNLECEIDLNNTKRIVLTIDQETSSPFSRKKDSVKVYSTDGAYTFGIARVVQAFAKEKGYVLDQHQLSIDMTDMILFELELIEIIFNGKEDHLVTNNYERMTIKQLQRWYNSSGVTSPTAKINFLEVLQHAFKLANITINSSEPIVVYNPGFLHDVARLLANTSSRVLVNYVQWNMVNKFLLFTTQEMRDIKFDISSSKYNISNSTPRWKTCIENIEMKDAISYMYVKRYFSDHVNHEVTRLIKKIEVELRHSIRQAHWLPSATKAKLMQKLDTLDTQIGYPEWYKDEKAVIRYYDGLHIGSDYFKNILNCQEVELKNRELIFRDVVKNDQWFDYPTTINAFHIPTSNSIIVPAAELHDPYFAPLLPDAVNYGTVGFIIGHELSHCFDSKGILFNKDGYKTLWASQHTSDEYEKRTMCFVDQYGNYTLDITNEDGEYVMLDGRLTRDENMADSNGVQIAYSAYKKATKQKPQTKLPGLEYISNDELFFLTFANSWCYSARPEYEAVATNVDEHSPPKYRVIGSLSNMAAFSRTFKCSQNSSMNQQTKCSLWN